MSLKSPRPNRDSARVLRAARSDERLNRAYHSLVPARARRMLRHTLPLRLRLAARHHSSRLGSAVSSLFSGLRKIRSTGLRPGESFAMWNRHRIVANQHLDPSPIIARRKTLDLAIKIMERAGVDYFCVRSEDPLTSAIAVPETSRAKVIDAIVTQAQHSAFYLTVPDCTDFEPGHSHKVAQSRPKILRLINFLVDPRGLVTLGPQFACDIEFWKYENEKIRAPRPNRCTELVDLTEEPTLIAESAFTSLVTKQENQQRQYRSRVEFVGDLVDDIDFPIDAVFTWVDHTDPQWRRRRAAAAQHTDTTALNGQSANEARFTNRDELRFAMRSINTYAPWINRIWLVTDNQVPAWLDIDNSKVTVVDHADIFTDPSQLPTFNSHAIESQLHNIDGIAEHFLYFNDDMLLGNIATPQQFFTTAGNAKIFASTRKLGMSQANASDIPATAAGKNSRELIAKTFGRTTTTKFLHCPYALRRSVLADMWQEFGDALTTTAGHDFRHLDDVSPTSSLYQYFAILTGRADFSQISNMYIDISTPRAQERLRNVLASRDYTTFCVNDTNSHPADETVHTAILENFLSAYFPQQAPWEL